MVPATAIAPPLPIYPGGSTAPAYYGAPETVPYDAPQTAAYDAPPMVSYGTPQQAPYGAPQQAPYGAPQPASYGALQPAQYGALQSVQYGVSPAAHYGVAPSAHYGAPPSMPYGASQMVHHGAAPTVSYGAPSTTLSHAFPPPPNGAALMPYSAPPMYGGLHQLAAPLAHDADQGRYEASMPAPASQGPFHFAHLMTVKLSADNYLLWRAQVLPLLRSHYLEGYVDGSLPCPPAMLHMTSAAGAPVMAPNPAHRQWVAQDQAILGAIQSSLTPSVAGMVIFAAT
jgi:hypothetical protein